MPYKSRKQAAYMHIHEPEIAARWDEEYHGKRKRKVSKSLAELGEIAKKLLKPAHIKALQTEHSRGIIAALTQGTDDATKLAIRRGAYAGDRLKADEVARAAGKETGEMVRSGSLSRYANPRYQDPAIRVRRAKSGLPHKLREATAPQPRRRNSKATMRRWEIQSSRPDISRYRYAREEMGLASTGLKYRKAGGRNRWEF